MGIGLKDIIKDDRNDLIKDKQKRTMKGLLFAAAIIAILIVIVVILIIVKNTDIRRQERIRTISIDMGNISEVVKSRGKMFLTENNRELLIGQPLDQDPQIIVVNGSNVEYRYNYYYVDKDNLKELTTALNNVNESYFVNYMNGDVVNLTGVQAKNGKKYYSIEDITAVASNNSIPNI